LIFGTILSLTFLVSSCNGDDDASPIVSQNPDTVINIVRNGNWKITYYYDSDREETSDFNGYNFTFGTGNVLTASNGTNNYTGTWSVTNDDSSDDDSSSNDLDFNIAFSSPERFMELTDDWDIIEQSATVIKLRDVSGGSGGTDYLTFTKN